MSKLSAAILACSFLVYSSEIVALSLESTSISYGNSAQVQRTFTLRETTDTVGKWFESHREDVKKAGGCQVIEYKNDKMRVRKDTLRGRMEWTEQLTKEGDVFVSKLVEVHQGRIVNTVNKAWFVKTNDGCSVILQTYTEVDGATPTQIKREVNKSMIRVQELFEKNFKH